MNDERYINPKNIDLKLGALEADGELLIPLSAVRAAIAVAPSEDVVKVVRCEDCKHAKMINENSCVCKNTEAPYMDGVEDDCEHYRHYNDFCSYGERRTTDEQAD